ncbi:hypothetical protein OAH93_02290 [Flavobacteriales bacterium]|nr:hypothetical protein [Flavobacteriales bacterium]
MVLQQRDNRIMAIKRYYASADNTITNAFQANLKTRATGANMGLSDILEVYSIYGQESSGSQELSRVLVKFDLSGAANTIGSDASSGKLKLSNKASCTFAGTADLASDDATELIVRNADGTSVTFTTDDSKAETASTATLIGTSGVSTTAKAAQSLHVAFAAAITAGTLKMTLTPSSYTDETQIELTQKKRGSSGNTTVTIPDNIIANSTEGDGSSVTTSTFTNGTNGANFYLRMFNAEHGQTLPKNAILVVEGLQTDWNEGHGLDMEEFSDLSNGDGSSNWEYANSGNGPATAATATIAFTDACVVNETIVIISTDGTSRTYTAKGSTTAGSLQFINTNAATAATALASCINNAAGHTSSKITVVDDGAGTLTLTQVTLGLSGDTAITSTLSNVTVSGFSGGFDAGLGRVAWARQGGNFHQSPSFTASFAAGAHGTTGSGPTADLQVNVTDLIYEWYDYDSAYGKKNHGFIVRLTGSQEAYYQGNPAGTDHDGNLNNLTGSTTSYYTKKFFARGTEFFYKQPCLEARWNDAVKDNTGNVWFSSSLAPQAENLNTIYMYNYVRGQLRNIPDIGTGPIYVELYSGSVGNTSPSTSSVLLPQGGGVVSAGGSGDQPPGTVITGGYYATGIYTASFAITSSTADYNPPTRLFSSNITKIYAVWSNTGKHEQAGRIEFLTSSFYPQKLDTPALNPATSYASSITNLRSIYSTNEQARFRLYVRQKDWNPTIYTKATTEADTFIIDSGSYRFFRVIDELDVIPFGTGSLLHTQTSYDVSGNYFDVDMRLFEPGYAYGIKLAYYNGSVGSWVEQPETFKFRVE